MASNAAVLHVAVRTNGSSLYSNTAAAEIAQHWASRPYRPPRQPADMQSLLRCSTGPTYRERCTNKGHAVCQDFDGIILINKPGKASQCNMAKQAV
eukprot:750798-Hanusia_phi.AAC.2